MVAARFLIIFAMTFVLANARNYNPNFYEEKPGSCSPPISVGLCINSCKVDGHCPGNTKCCPTSCGSNICSRPVTMRPEPVLEKIGACPTRPTGRWICSSTCSSDGDCMGTSKCCENRCGALACQEPEAFVPAYE